MHTHLMLSPSILLKEDTNSKIAMTMMELEGRSSTSFSKTYSKIIKFVYAYKILYIFLIKFLITSVVVCLSTFWQREKCYKCILSVAACTCVEKLIKCITKREQKNSFLIKCVECLPFLKNWVIKNSLGRT